MTECPKCQYVRKPNDYGPESVCPKCGIVYKKFLDRDSVLPHHNALDSKSSPPPKAGKWVKNVVLILGPVLILSAFFVWKYGYKQSHHVGGEAVSYPSVIIYTTPRCGYCNVAKSFFRQHGVGYFEYDITSSQQGLRKYRELNGRGVPLILVGQTRMDGYNEHALRSALQREGLL